MTTGDAVASWYRHSIALPSSSRLVLLPSPPPPTPTNGPFEPASLSLSLRPHPRRREHTHANFLDVSPGPCPQDIPRDAREFTGEERSGERERESVRANSSVYSSSSHPSPIYFPSVDRDLLLGRNTHEDTLGGVRLRRKGDPRSGYRPTLAPSPAFSHRIPHQARDQPLSTANVDTRRTPDRSSCLSRPGPGAQYRECYGGRTGREKEFNRCAQSSWSVLLLLSRPLSSRFSRTEHSARILMVVTFFHASSYNNHGKRETSERSEEKSASIDCLPICPPSSSFQDESRRKILPENRSNFSPHLEMYVRIRPHVNDTRPLVVSLYQTTARISFEKKLVQYYIDSFDAKEGEAIPSQDLLLPSPPPTIGARSPGFRLSKSSKRARVFSRVAANRTKSRSRIG